MMDRHQRKVLEYLLDSYERSRTFRGDNQVTQTFSASVGKIFPKYNDDAEYDYFCQINESMEELCDEGLVTLSYWKKGVLKKITLNLKRLDDLYVYGMHFVKVTSYVSGMNPVRSIRIR